MLLQMCKPQMVETLICTALTSVLTAQFLQAVCIATPLYPRLTQTR